MAFDSYRPLHAGGLWALLPLFAKRFLRAPVFWQLLALWLLFQIVMACIETSVIVRASMDGCLSVLTKSVAPRCLTPYLKLYELLGIKVDVFTVIYTSSYSLRLLFLTMVLVKSSLVDRFSGTWDPSRLKAERLNGSTDHYGKAPSRIRTTASALPAPKAWSDPEDPSSPSVTEFENEDGGSDSLWSRFWNRFVIGDWSVASSKDVYVEVAASLRSAAFDVLVLSILKTCFATALPGIVTDLAFLKWNWRNAGPRPVAYLEAVCGDSPSMNLCHLGYLGRRVITDIGSDLENVSFLTLILPPIGVYHRLSFSAAAKTSHGRFMWRFLVLAPVVWVTVANALWYPISSALQRVWVAQATKAEVEVVTGVRFAYICVLVVLILYIFEIDVSLARWAGRLIAALRGNTVPQEVDSVDPSGASGDQSPEQKSRWSFSEIFRYVYEVRRSGLRVRQMFFLFIAVSGFQPVGHAYGYGRFWLTWAARLVYILLLLVQRDGESTFEDLRVHGAGFGLLVDASDLRRSIKATLGGEKFSGRLRRYEGTMFRMQQTMAVSYRWQECQTRLSDSAMINMNTWQLQQLLRALSHTGCLYVWIDALAIPQDGSALQNQLLSRMMAVYSSCSSCIVLRTVEKPKERYHQRAWTIQEWCTCKGMHVSSEEEPQEPEEQDPLIGPQPFSTAVTLEETSMYGMYRAWQQRRAKFVCPIWVEEDTGIDALPDADFRQMWTEVVGISSQVNCQVPFDKIRAIFPLIWNAPTSTHSELCALVGKVLERVEQMHLYPARINAWAATAPANESSSSTLKQRVPQGRGTGSQGSKSLSGSAEGDVREPVASTRRSFTEPGSLVGQAPSDRGTAGGQGVSQSVPEGAAGELIELMRQMVEDHSKVGGPSDE